MLSYMQDCIVLWYIRYVGHFRLKSWHRDQLSWPELCYCFPQYVQFLMLVIWDIVLCVLVDAYQHSG